MDIFINDTPIVCPDNCMLTELLQLREIIPVNIAIAINDNVIAKKEWIATEITQGCHIIIIKAVQGG